MWWLSILAFKFVKHHLKFSLYTFSIPSWIDSYACTGHCSQTCLCMYIVKELPELSILQSSHVLKYRAIEISCSFLVQFAKDNVLLHVFKPWILTGSFFLSDQPVLPARVKVCIEQKFVPPFTCYTNSNGTCDYYSCVGLIAPLKYESSIKRILQAFMSENLRSACMFLKCLYYVEQA